MRLRAPSNNGVRQRRSRAALRPAKSSRQPGDRRRADDIGVGRGDPGSGCSREPARSAGHHVRSSDEGLAGGPRRVTDLVYPDPDLGLAALLSSRSEVELVGLAGDGVEVVRLSDETAPDVIVMDLHMPEVTGTDAIGRITRASPHIAVLVLTMLEDDDSLFAAMRAGARGYLVKGASQDQILGAILAVARGEAVFGPAVANRVLDYFFREPPGRTSDLFPELTDRERHVLELIAQGLDNPTISRRLGLSGKTVRNYVSNIFAKLHVADRSRPSWSPGRQVLGAHSSTGRRKTHAPKEVLGSTRAVPAVALSSTHGDTFEIVSTATHSKAVVFAVVTPSRILGVV